MQIMPATFEEIASENPGIGGGIYEPRWNIAAGIYYNRRKIFAIARAQEIPTNEAADHLAEERIRTVARLKAAFLGNNTGPTRQLQFLQNRRAKSDDSI